MRTYRVVSRASLLSALFLCAACHPFDFAGGGEDVPEERMELTITFEGTTAAQTKGSFTLSGAMVDEGSFEGWSNHDGTGSLPEQKREELYYGEKTLVGNGGRALLVYSGLTSDGGRTARGWFRISQGTGIYIGAQSTGEFELRCTGTTTVMQGRIATMLAGEAW